MQREPGFYWVKRGPEWGVAYYDELEGVGGRFELYGREGYYPDRSFTEIGPRITPPEEKE